MPRFEYKSGRYSAVFEIERDGCTVHSATGDADKVRTKTKTYDTEDEARFAEGKLLARYRYYKPAGVSKHIPATPIEPGGSQLLVDEAFAAGSERFLSEVLALRTFSVGNYAERWFTDKRPQMRRMLLAYIDDGCTRTMHQSLVKRLFKLAEKAGDDEVMAHFMVAFDGMRIRLVVPARWGGGTELRGDPTLPTRIAYGKKTLPNAPQFSRATRQYLARRAYRYFRKLAHTDVARYGKAMRLALPLYRDEALDSLAKLLDAWGLLHALYARSKALRREPTGIKLASDATLGALRPAPHFRDAWLGAGRFDELFAMLLAAQSRTVRTWTTEWLREHFAKELAQLAYPQVKRLLLSPHEELQTLGAHALEKVTGLETLPITEWIELLAIENLDVLPAICAVVAKHVTPARLTLDQCIALACARTAPVAELGLQWAKTKKIEGDAELRALARLGKAGVPTVRSEATGWASQTIAAHPKATPEHVRELCDAPHADARAQALAIVAAKEQLAPPALWFALTESPYDDVRAVVLRQATKWRDEAPKTTLRHVWTTATLAVHTGSAAKRRVPRQIAERIAAHPDEAAELLPVLGLALRSVRPPERATALAALARAITANPELRALARQHLPELEVTEQVAS